MTGMYIYREKIAALPFINQIAWLTPSWISAVNILESVRAGSIVMTEAAVGKLPWLDVNCWSGTGINWCWCGPHLLPGDCFSQEQMRVQGCSSQGHTPKALCQQEQICSHTLHCCSPQNRPPTDGQEQSLGKGIFVLFCSYADTCCLDKHSGVCLFLPLSVQIFENTALWEQVFGTAAQDDRWIFIFLCGLVCNYPCLPPCRSSS